MKKLLLFLPIFLLAACTSGGGNNPNVTLMFPKSGSVIYAEALVIQGTLEDKAELPVKILLVNLETEEIIVQTTATLETVWTLEVPLNYTGEPLQTELRILSEDEATNFGSSQIIIADQSFRPEGTFATIAYPQNDSTIGGDSVQIDGTASGIVDNMLTVRLFDSADNALSSQTFEISNPHFIDEVPWHLTVQLADLLDLARIQIISTDESGNEVTLDEVAVSVESAAG